MGTVADGEAINTASLGQKTITVTATDVAGNTKVLDRTYTVVAARPDGRIRRGTGPVVGNNIYNTTGAGQTRTGAAARGQAVTFYVTAQNDQPSPNDSGSKANHRPPGSPSSTATQPGPTSPPR